MRDKDGVRPGEPGYDPRTLYIPKSAWNEFTPFEKQFWEIKQNHFDTILFFQKGKFLELYEEDARVGHREFDLKLTQRVKMSMVYPNCPYQAQFADARVRSAYQRCLSTFGLRSSLPKVCTMCSLRSPPDP